MVNSSVSQIKERLSIEKVISSYIKLEKSGANFKARCPFHNEKTPSFFVSVDRGGYYCFGCAAKGDIFTFVEEFEGLDFKGALKILAERAGVSLKDFNPEKEGEKERLYKAMEAASLFFENNLKEEKEVLEYLKHRGLEEKIIQDFRIGFIRNDWRLLFTYLQKKGFSDLEIEKAGLAKKTDKGFYDRFRGRIMFPISDSSGRIIAFSGRIWEKSVPTPKGVGTPTLQNAIVGAKYLNSPDTPIFNKSSVLYGLDKAKDSIRKNNFSILVEGQMDLVLSHQAGFKNTVATSGTALSDSLMSKENAVSNLGLLRRLSENIVLAFDADRAGVKAVARGGKIALSLGMDVKVAGMPEGVDPADLISKDGVDAWRSAVRSSKHIVEFVLDKVLNEYKDDTRKAGRTIKEKVLPFVDALGSNIEKAGFLRKISAVSQIREEDLRADLSKIEKESKYEKEELIKVKTNEFLLFRKDYILRRLLGIILWQKSLANKMIETEDIVKQLTGILNTDEEKLFNKTIGNNEDLIFEAEVFYGNGIDLEKDVGELIRNLAEEELKERLFRKMQELQDFENKKDQEMSAKILQEINEINKKIQDIKNGRPNK